jgi:hypothetical protein
MNTPDDSVAFSKANAGEIADEPDDVFDLAVQNKDGETVGFVEKWNGAEWIYAETAATRWMQRKRCSEYSEESKENEGSRGES